MSRKLIIIICTLVIGIILVRWMSPKIVHAHSGGHGNYCVLNLREINGAKEQWAQENKKVKGDFVTLRDLQPYLGCGPEGTLPICPHGGIYEPGRVGEEPKCTVDGPLSRFGN